MTSYGITDVRQIAARDCRLNILRALREMVYESFDFQRSMRRANDVALDSGLFQSEVRHSVAVLTRLVERVPFELWREVLDEVTRAWPQYPPGSLRTDDE